MMGSSSPASQIAYLTMRLKDKLHPQRTRRPVKLTPSLRLKPPDLNLQQPQVHTHTHTRLCVSVRTRSHISTLYLKLSSDVS